mmetsp:Transcript_24253/g.65094  ORF Transcript_24253/g.65094 Transcript_24253/m.65094 type:complete len:80 (-) Transcript_24253:314-553(-)
MLDHRIDLSENCCESPLLNACLEAIREWKSSPSGLLPHMLQQPNSKIFWSHSNCLGTPFFAPTFPALSFFAPALPDERS